MDTNATDKYRVLQGTISRENADGERRRYVVGDELDLTPEQADAYDVAQLQLVGEIAPPRRAVKQTPLGGGAPAAQAAVGEANASNSADARAGLSESPTEAPKPPDPLAKAQPRTTKSRG